MLRPNHALIALICSTIFLTACGGKEDIKGEGNPISETREVASFHGIDVSGRYDILAEIGSPQSLAVTSNPNLLPYIESTVKNEILRIANKDSSTIHPSFQQKISIVMPTFDSLTLSGASTFSLPNLDSKSLEISLAGSHQVLISGRTENMKVVMDGTSSINAKDLIAEDVDIVINGTGLVAVNPSHSLKVVINGSGKVINYGKGRVQQTINGAGQVETAQ